MSFVAVWAVFGTIATALLAVTFLRLSPLRFSPSEEEVDQERSRERLWLAVATGSAFLIPVLIRLFLLRGAPLTDDEGAYRFAAQLLASGRLSVHSHPLKIFFDQSFFINDGRFYTAYFLGWPALMVPGIWLRCAGFMNAVYSALTLPALYLIMRRLLDRTSARVAAALFLTSPFLQVAAATEGSHTSTLMLLTWMVWLYLKRNDKGLPTWRSFGFGLTVAAAFFERPATALGLGLPFVVLWLLDLRSLPRQQALARLGAFAAAVIPLAGLFLGANHALNGSIWLTSSQRDLQYIELNHFRFSTFDASWKSAIPAFSFHGLRAALATTGSGLFRLNFDMSGWPVSLLLALFGTFYRKTRLFSWSIVTFLLVHLFLHDPGIDSYGPVHYLELALPLFILICFALSELGRIIAARLDNERATPPAGASATSASVAVRITGALVLAALLGFVPFRLAAVYRIAENINIPREAVRKADLHQAVIFSSFPFAPPCQSYPTSYFVFFHPPNDPDLTNDILWVNDVSPRLDRDLMSYFPDRTGYRMRWTKECRVLFEPLKASSGTPPPGAN